MKEEWDALWTLRIDHAVLRDWDLFFRPTMGTPGALLDQAEAELRRAGGCYKSEEADPCAP